MLWHNPVLKKKEERPVPADDAAAREILADRPGAVEEYDGWRDSQDILTSMLQTGEAFRQRDTGKREPL